MASMPGAKDGQHGGGQSFWTAAILASGKEHKRAGLSVGMLRVPPENKEPFGGC